MTPDCAELETLAAFLDHALTPTDRDSVERHLVICHLCRETIKTALPLEYSAQEFLVELPIRTAWKS